MSGVAGGNRIKKQDVQDTFNDFENKVLKKIPGYKAASLSGSVKAGTKADFGDLDVISTFEYDDKKLAKQAIIDTVSKMPDSLIMPFQSDRYKGKKFYNSGEIISVLYPIKGAPGETIQVDIMVSLSETEHQFKNSFLDLPAEVQGLILGLVKTALVEQKPAEVFARLGIKNLPPLEPNQEYEFNLSSVNLTLRKVTLDNFKEVAREEIWKSNNWSDVQNLLKDFDLNQPFEKLLDQVARSLTNPRSKNRVAGIFRSMVSVKSGEVGTPKGDNKEKALTQVAQTLAEAEGSVIGLYGGGFKPPHRGHFHIAKELAKDVDSLKIYIGAKIREGETITAQQSKEIWEVYAKYLGKPTEIQIAPITPILSIYQEIEANQQQDYLVGSSSDPEDVDKFKALQLNKKNLYDRAKLKTVSTINESKLSATIIRTDADYLKTGNWMPEELSAEDKKAVLGILKATPEYKMAEAIDDVFSSFLGEGKKEKAEKKEEETSEVTMGTPVTPIAVVPSELRQRMQNLTTYFQKLAPDDVIVDFNGQSIVITPMYYNKAVPGDYTPEQKPIEEYQDTAAAINYVPYIAGILEHMLKKGMKVMPLPEIVTIEDKENAANVLGRTAFYNPTEKKVGLFVTGRHPKDVLRSFCHEMIHHMQNLEGRLPAFTTTNTQEDSALNEIEKEAHYLGSMTMREWEDSVKQQDTVNENKVNETMTVYRLGEIPYDENSFFVTPDYRTWAKFYPNEEIYKITTNKLYLPLVNKSFSSFDELRSKYESGEFTDDDIAYINPEESGIQNFEQYEIKPEDIIDLEQINEQKKKHPDLTQDLREGTKYRSIVADVRRAVNDALNTLLSGKKLKGYNVKTKREPTKKDLEFAEKYGMSPLGAMLYNEYQSAYLGEFTSKSEKGTKTEDGKPVNVGVSLKFAQTDEVEPGKFHIDGEAGSDEGEIDIILAFNPADGTNMLQRIQPILTDLIRHETEHLTQSGVEVRPDKWMRKDEARRRAIRQDPESWYKYYMLPKEVDANIQGLYTKSKYEKKDFQSTVDQYLEDLVQTGIITVGNKQKIYDLWKSRIPQIGGIPNLK